VERTEAGCPLCGGAPVAGVVLGDDKLRYLVCGLCATQWHHTRAQCVLCRSSSALAYLALDGPAPGPAKAEACQACRAYLKLLYVELDPRLEPFADDVASLALDLLVAERGLERLGQSLFLYLKMFSHTIGSQQIYGIIGSEEGRVNSEGRMTIFQYKTSLTFLCDVSKMKVWPGFIF